MDYSIVIPVYNTLDSLIELVKRINSTFRDISDSYEIIFIDDSSSNADTWPALKKLRDNDRRIKIVQLRYNHGQQKAIICGFGFCRGKYVITMDDDLQHLPEEIPKLIDAIKEDESVDVIIGLPEPGKKKHNLLKKTGSWLLNKADELVLKKPKGVKRGSFRIMSRDIASEVIKLSNNSPTIGSLIFRATQRVKSITARHDRRKEGKTGYGFTKLVSLTLDNVLNYSSLPTKLVAMIGFLYFLFSFCLAGWAFYNKITRGISVPGWTSLLIIQSVSGGIIMGALGIVGEYLIRIIRNTGDKKPVISVRQALVED